MPILDDIMDHELFGPAIRKGLEQGRMEGARRIVLGLMERRFGPTPSWACERVDSLSIEQLETLGLELLDDKSLNELLGCV